MPPVEIAGLGGASLWRCGCCGARWSRDGFPRRVTFCARCEAPFLAVATDEVVRCPACRGGAGPLDLPEGAAVAAAEMELRIALGRRWPFVGSPELSPYLERVAAAMARALDWPAASPAVALVAEPVWRCFGLPSGTIVLSLGGLDSVEDEAELAFVLAHELAHAAARDAGASLVRLGLAALTRAPRGGEDEAWLFAALDLSRLGFSERREHAADARAVDALARAGYDGDAARRWIERLGRAAAEGDPACAELVLAHPPARDRLRRLERRPTPTVAPVERRVNREVLRRVLARAGPPLVPGPARPFDEPERRQLHVRRRWLRVRGAVWTAVTIALLATLLLLFGLL